MKLSRLALLALLALLLTPLTSLYAQTPTTDVARTGIDKEVIYFVCQIAIEMVIQATITSLD